MTSAVTADSNVATTVAKPTTREEVDVFVRQLTVKVLMLEDIKPESIDPKLENFLIDLGANSIDALEVIVTVEEKLGVEFHDSELNADLVKTLDHFVNAICDKLSISRPQETPPAAPTPGIGSTSENTP